MRSSRATGVVAVPPKGASAVLWAAIAFAAMSGCAPRKTMPPAREQPRELAPTSDLEHARRDLLQTLAVVEAELASADDERAAVLRELRLRLTVAIAELQRRIAWGRHDDTGGDARDVTGLLERARGRIAAVRQRQTADRRQTGKGLLWRAARAWATRDLEQANKKEKQADRGRDDANLCAPGDPFCSDLDPLDELDEGEDPKTEKSKRRPVFKPSPRPTKKPPGKALRATPYPDAEPTPPGEARVARRRAPRGVMREVHRHFGRVARCLPSAARTEVVRIGVVLRVTDSGQFRDPRVSASRLDARAIACIADVFSSVRVPDYQDGSRVVRFPLWVPPEE